MVAVQTIPNLGPLTVEQAERWLAAALAEARALRAHDDQMYPREPDPSALAVANEIHVAWDLWATAAEALEGRVLPLVKLRQHVQGVTDLGHEIGRVRARLQVTPADHLEGLEEIRQGKTVPHEEVRREFRDRVARTRAAGFSRLDILLQELVLDEVERMAAGGGLIPHRALPLSTDFDLSVESAGRVHYAFVRVEYDDPRRLLIVARVNSFDRPVQ